jgi:hypothetical protein
MSYTLCLRVLVATSHKNMIYKMNFFPVFVMNQVYLEIVVNVLWLPADRRQDRMMAQGLQGAVLPLLGMHIIPQ